MSMEEKRMGRTAASPEKDKVRAVDLVMAELEAAAKEADDLRAEVYADLLQYMEQYRRMHRRLRDAQMDCEGEFAQFWAAYPKKKKKQMAREKYRRHCYGKVPLEKQLETIAAYRRTEEWANGFIPDPTTWINNRMWDDDPGTLRQAEQQYVERQYVERQYAAGELDRKVRDPLQDT